MSRSLLAISVAMAVLILPAVVAMLTASAAGGLRGYEPTYFEGQTVLVNVIELRQVAPLQAQAAFYEIVYPIGWEDMDVGTPQCNPCDHPGDGPSFDDFHDHILDSVPWSPGHGAYSPLWHVFVVLPAYSFLTGGDSANDDAIGVAYASVLKVTSEDAVGGLLAMQMPDGSPVAIIVDTHFYFLCAVVNPNAGS